MSKLQLAELTLLVVVLGACADRAEQLFDDARRAMEQDDYETAARLYREVTIEAPASPRAAEAHFELAQIYYLRLRDVDAAKDRLQKVLQEYPSSPIVVDARHMLARLYEDDLKDPKRAVKLYRALLAEDLEEDMRRRTLFDIGECHYRLGELEASANAYRLALKLPYHPDTDTAYMRLANLEWLAGSSGESLRLLRELQERTEEEDYRHDAMLAEIEILMSLGRFAAAHERLLVAREVFSDSPHVVALGARLRATQAEHESLDGRAGEALLQELQKRLRWGGGRRRRR